MRLAFITYEFPPDTGKGGIGTYTSQVAKMLASHGTAVHVFCGSPHRTAQKTMDGYTVHRIHSANGNEFKENVVELFTILHRERPFDIIESPEINSNAFFIKQKFPGLPLVVRLHAPDYLVESLKKKYYSFFVKLRFSLGALKRGRLDAGYWRSYNFLQDKDYNFCKMASQLTAPSAAMQEWTKKNWQIPIEKIDVIPNPFIPLPGFLALPVNKTATHKVIVFFGRLNVLKGLVNATYAVKRILKEFPGWHFRVIGDNGPGPNPGISMKKWMQEQLADVTGRVQFISGYTYEALPGLIANAEIALLPSLFESFSYTCAEAMAAGKAVIGSERTGMEFMENNKTGILVNAEQSDEIYAALKKLIVDDDFRFQIAMNAREAVTALFSEKIVAKKYIDCYIKTIEENSLISLS